MLRHSSTSVLSVASTRAIGCDPGLLLLLVAALLLFGSGCSTTTEVTRTPDGYREITEAASGETAHVFLRDGRRTKLYSPQVKADSTVGSPVAGAEFAATGGKQSLPTSAVREVEIVDHRKGTIHGIGLGATPFLIGILGATRERGVNELFVTDLGFVVGLVSLPLGGYLGRRKGARENYRFVGPPSDTGSVPSPVRAQQPKTEDDTVTARADSMATTRRRTAKSPGTALIYSLGGTVALTPVFGVGLLVGPAFGHFYADANERAWQGIGVRGGLLLGSAAVAYIAPEGNSSAVLLATAGFLAIPVHAVYDIIRARDSALDYNRTHGVRAHVAPTMDLHREQVGLALRVSF